MLKRERTGTSNSSKLGNTDVLSSSSSLLFDNLPSMSPSDSSLGMLDSSLSIDTMMLEEEQERNHWIDANITPRNNFNSNSNSSNIINIHSNNNEETEKEPFLQSSIHKYKEEIMRKRKMVTKKSQLCKYTVDRVEGILLPTSSSSRIPLIKGLERVLNGTQPASEAIATCGMKPHRFIWFIISGLLCDIVQFMIDLILYYVLKIQSSTLCWAIGLSLSIAIRHTSHRYLVFGNYVGGYFHSLIRMYTGYSIILISSTVFNLALVEIGHLKHYTAWVVTLIMTNVMNYFLLRKLWSWDSGKRWKRCLRKSSTGTGTGSSNMDATSTRTSTSNYNNSNEA